MPMKLVSWNVNGLRTSLNNNFLDVFAAMDADVFLLQETRMQEGQGGVDFPGYHAYWHFARRPGYSGTAVLTMRKPEQVLYGLGEAYQDAEGRVMSLDMGNFWLVNCYAPHAQESLARLPERLQWDDALYEWVKRLEGEKPVILGGDLNVSYRAADLKALQPGQHAPGFTREERQNLLRLLRGGYVDTFRHFHPDADGVCSWWLVRRGRRAGGRIDYFLASERLLNRLVSARVYTRITGSDHCPVELVMQSV